MAARPLSTTVVRYQQLNLSRGRGNAVRQHIEEGGGRELNSGCGKDD
jgi:hypothetical protein